MNKRIGSSWNYIKGHANGYNGGYNDGYIEGIKMVCKLINNALYNVSVIKTNETVPIDNDVKNIADKWIKENCEHGARADGARDFAKYLEGSK